MGRERGKKKGRNVKHSEDMLCLTKMLAVRSISDRKQCTWYRV